MDYTIPLKKQSKKNKREYYSKMRKKWDINPVCKVVPDKKKKFKEKIDFEIED